MLQSTQAKDLQQLQQQENEEEKGDNTASGTGCRVYDLRRNHVSQTTSTLSDCLRQNSSSCVLCSTQVKDLQQQQQQEKEEEQGDSITSGTVAGTMTCAKTML